MRQYVGSAALVAALCSLSLATACGGGKGGSGPKGGPDAPQGENPSAPGPQPSPAPSPAPAITAGTVALDLEGATAVGIVEIDANSQLKASDGSVIDPAKAGTVGIQLTAGSAKVLAKLTSGGPVGFVLPPEVKNIPVELTDAVAAGAWGTILRFSLPDQFLVKTNVALVDAKDGHKVKPLRPQGDGEFRCDRLEYDDDDKLYGHCNAGLFVYDFAKGAFTALTDGEQLVDRFLRLADGNVYLQGRTKASDAKFLRRLKPNGGFEDLVTPRGSLVFESVASLGTRGVMMNRVMRVVDDQLKFHFLPESYFKADGDSGPGIVVNNAWLVAQGGEKRFAFDLSTDKVAGNPLGAAVPRNLAGGSKTAPPHTNVDSVVGLYYDGANVVSLEYAAGAITAKQVLKLVYPNGPSLKIERLFGPDHGFVGVSWYGYAVAPDGALFWVAVDRTTGVVDMAGRKRIALPEGVNAIDVTTDTTVYAVGGKTVVYSGGAYPTAQLSWLEENGDGGLSMAPKLALFAGGAQHAGAVLAGSVLLAVDVNGSSVQRYDPQANATALQTKVDALQARLSGEGGSTDLTCAVARAFQSLVRTAEAGKVLLLGRLCEQTLGANDGSFVVLKLSASDFSTASVDLRVDTGLSALELNNGQSRTRLVRMKEGDGSRLALVVPASGKIRPLKADLSGVEASDRLVSQIATDGLVPFGGKYPATAGAVEVALPWAGDSFLVSGNVGAGYKSFRVNLRESRAKIDDEATYAVTSLDGVQVYGGGLDKSGTLIVSGLRSADNKRVLVRFSPQFEVLDTDATSNVKVLKVVAVGGD